MKRLNQPQASMSQPILPGNLAVIIWQSASGAGQAWVSVELNLE